MAKRAKKRGGASMQSDASEKSAPRKSRRLSSRSAAGPASRELAAKQAIAELSYRYMRGLDRLDRELLASVFHADARVNYGFFAGRAADFVDFAMRALESHGANHHMIGQVLIELRGAQATGEIYFQAFHRIVEAGAEKDLFIAGRYVDRYALRDGAWKIAFRSEVNDWARTEAAADGYFRASPQGLRGGRKPDDWSYRREQLEG
jgi:SnoaL-like domain